MFKKKDTTLSKNRKQVKLFKLKPLKQKLKIMDWVSKYLIGSGSFGDIYLVLNKDKEHYAVLKVESCTKFSYLAFEGKLYLYFMEAVGIPKMYKYFSFETQQCNLYNAMIIELLHCDVNRMMKISNGKLTVKTVAMLATQMIDRLEYVHRKGFIYRDIKPHNFCMGFGKKSKMVYLVDFGLTKFQKDPLTQYVVKYNENSNLAGTVKFTSLNVHRSIEQSFRDDMESLGYVLVYLVNGRMPWDNIKYKNKRERNKKIYKIKNTISIEELCENLPYEFIKYFKCVRKLQFHQVPDYAKYRALFYKILISNNESYDFNWDWNNFNEQSKRKDFLNARKSMQYFSFNNVWKNLFQSEKASGSTHYNKRTPTASYAQNVEMITTNSFDAYAKYIEKNTFSSDLSILIGYKDHVSQLSNKIDLKLPKHTNYYFYKKKDLYKLKSKLILNFLDAVLSTEVKSDELESLNNYIDMEGIRNMASNSTEFTCILKRINDVFRSDKLNSCEKFDKMHFKAQLSVINDEVRKIDTETYATEHFSHNREL